jgi:hypothetical protein
LKSVDAHRWVPKPSSLTKISDPPRRRNFIPELATLPISLVGPLAPSTVGLAEAGFWLPPKKPPKSELARRTLRRFVVSFIDTNIGADGGAKATAPVTNRRTPAHRFIIMVMTTLTLWQTVMWNVFSDFDLTGMMRSKSIAFLSTD